jgi:hypothetical protein
VLVFGNVQSWKSVENLKKVDGKRCWKSYIETVIASLLLYILCLARILFFSFLLLFLRCTYLRRLFFSLRFLGN